VGKKDAAYAITPAKAFAFGYRLEVWTLVRGFGKMKSKLRY